MEVFYNRFAFTVKILGLKPSKCDEKDYEVFFDSLYKKCMIVNFKIAEFDSKGLLHYHGVITLKKNYYRKKLIVKGYHLHVTKLRSLFIWTKYCYKNIMIDTLTLAKNPIDLKCYENLPPLVIPYTVDKCGVVVPTV